MTLAERLTALARTAEGCARAVSDDGGDASISAAMTAVAEEARSIAAELTLTDTDHPWHIAYHGMLGNQAQVCRCHFGRNHA